MLAAILIGLLAAPVGVSVEKSSMQDSQKSIEGAWEVCGSSPGNLESMDPRGTPNMKALFDSKWKVFFQHPDKTMRDKQSLDVRDYIYRNEVLTLVNGDLISKHVVKFISADRFSATGEARSLLYCRIGAGLDSFDRMLQPQSIDHFITKSDGDKSIIANPKPRTPPEGSLLGTWELVRISVKPRTDSLPPYGFPTIRVVIDDKRLCKLSLNYSGDLSKECTSIDIHGAMIQVKQNNGDSFLEMFDTGAPLRLNEFGGLTLRGGRDDYEFAWVGPARDTSLPVPTRLMLINLIK